MTALTHRDLIAGLHAQAAADDAARLREQTTREVW